MIQEYVIDSCRLLLGDYAKVLKDVRGVKLLVTSPPYNVGSRYPKSTGGRRLGGYDVKSWGAIRDYPDSLPEDVYQLQQQSFLRWCLTVLAHDGVIVYNHKLRHRNGVLIKPEMWLLDLVRNGELVFYDEIVWDKRSTCNHTRTYVYQESERLYVMCRPGVHPYFHNEDFFWAARNGGVGDVWSIPPEPKKRNEKGHNAPFPLNLVRQVIRLWSKSGDLVMDPYNGSGTTMVAAMLEGRQFVGAEVLEKYFNMAVARIRKECEEHER